MSNSKRVQVSSTTCLDCERFKMHKPGQFQLTATGCELLLMSRLGEMPLSLFTSPRLALFNSLEPCSYSS